MQVFKGGYAERTTYSRGREELMCGVFRSGTVFLLLVATMVTGSCNRGGGEPEEQPTLEPTVTPLVLVEDVPTFTPTPIPPPPAPTEVPTSNPTSTPVPELAHTRVHANLRAGPGVQYAVVGQLPADTNVQPISQTVDRLWFKLDSGAWIFADLVEDAPLGLPVEKDIPAPPSATATPTSVPPTAVPSTPTPKPTSTPVPVRGDWTVPIPRNESYLARDGLEFTVREVIYGNDVRMQSYIERRGGQNCDECLAIELEVVNEGGNPEEYLAQEDFKLLLDSPDGEQFQQVRCQHGGGLRSMVNPNSLGAIAQGFGHEQKFVCFEGVPSDFLRLRLAYSPVFIYEDPHTPTPTPEGSSVVYATDPRERDQDFRTGWTVYFLLLGL